MTTTRPARVRPMTPAEKYYSFLDLTWPMNIMIVAELDIALPVEQVSQTWDRFCRLRSFPRLTAQSDLTICDIGADRVDFVGEELHSDQWHPRMDQEAAHSYGFDVPLRCRYYMSPDERRSRVVLIGHHAIVDGRVGVANLQSFVRALDGQDIVEQQQVSLPASPVEPRGYAWQRSKQELIATMREIRKENSADVQPGLWPEVSAERSPSTRPLVFDAGESKQLLATMKSHETGALPTMSALWLDAARIHTNCTAPATLNLGTAVDLAAPHTDPERPPAMTIGVVSNRFEVRGGQPWGLAQDISHEVSHSMRRGDGELLFHLSRVNTIDDLEAGSRVAAHTLRQSPPTVSVTNLGVVDPGSDPDWLRWMCGYLAPTPNQIVFVSGLGYRGQLVNSVTTDDLRLTPDQTSMLVSHFTESMRALRP